ncbi:hypothetical protein CAPTEDRAFT_207523 [Capitella teleta]|uniref:Reverse transcriptase domain-containing protein n=1 Tax=Capitella teleta TaxID=283909 RepID=R7UA09_CAPTE|nr:hypothetical protein CAPTEDRAFT_207523 [Capitella teleta]|eukprot:ELU00658.1 hypothetical protein CAPTEDRAFT_207523 [Capitella teleta]
MATYAAAFTNLEVPAIDWQEEKDGRLQTHGLSPKIKEKAETILGSIQEALQPKSNFRLTGHKLSSTRQLKGERVDVFIQRLQAIRKDCKYDKLDEQLIHALIFGLNSATVQKKLLQKDEDLTFFSSRICAHDIFQKLIHNTSVDLPGVTGIADDIVIIAFQEDMSNNNKNFQALRKRAPERNIKFNEEKLILKQKSMPFYGHVITDQVFRSTLIYQSSDVTLKKCECSKNKGKQTTVNPS